MMKSVDASLLFKLVFQEDFQEYFFLQLNLAQIRGITDVGIDKWRNKIVDSGGIIVSTARQMAGDSARWAGIRAAYPPTSGTASSCEEQHLL